MATNYKYETVQILATIPGEGPKDLDVIVRLMRHVDSEEFFVDIRKCRKSKTGEPYFLRSLGIVLPVSNIDTIAETMIAVAAAVKLSL